MTGFAVTSDFDDYVITLSYTDGNGTFLSFEPERQELIDINDGVYSFPTSNGFCSLHWCDNKFDFEVAKHGDGNGGMLRFTVLATPELRLSFQQAVIAWNEAVQKIGNGY